MHYRSSVRMPKKYYVYFHLDEAGNIFYVGKGAGRRAWSKDRHAAWRKYVDERLHGKYEVLIYQQGLTEPDAEELELCKIAELGNQLINWINPGRQFDYKALDRFHKLRDKNRDFVAQTRDIEKTDPNLAIERYRTALVRMREYESITTETGLVAEMNIGRDRGDPNILDRLTLCLIRSNRYAEAIQEASKYFEHFPSAKNLSVGKRIIARIEKAQSRISKYKTEPECPTSNTTEGKKL